MWWAFAIVIWTLLSFVASPLIGGVLAGGRALQGARKGPASIFRAAASSKRSASSSGAYPPYL